MSNADLHGVVRIKHMGEAAARRDAARITPDEGQELVSTYERIRQEAKALNRRAGWGDDESFDREMPPLVSSGSVQRLPRAMAGSQSQLDAIAAGRQALIRLEQLAAWAAGNQEAFELEARFEAEAGAKLKAQREEAKAAAKPPTGFGERSRPGCSSSPQKPA